MASLPAQDAKQRLCDIAALIDAGYDAANAKLETLLLSLPADFMAQLKAIQDEYWSGTVEPHVAEIASLTNNSAATVASVFRPTTDNADLGGITPKVLRRLGTEMRWGA